jgi:hypothetical protein
MRVRKQHKHTCSVQAMLMLGRFSVVLCNCTCIDNLDAVSVCITVQSDGAPNTDTL